MFYLGKIVHITGRKKKKKKGSDSTCERWDLALSSSFEPSNNDYFLMSIFWRQEFRVKLVGTMHYVGYSYYDLIFKLSNMQLYIAFSRISASARSLKIYFQKQLLYSHAYRKMAYKPIQHLW